MANFTSNTYQMKREILTFSNKISNNLPKPDKKFTADMIYGILASESCLLTDIVDQLHEDTKKINSVERLTRHLNKGIPYASLKSYLLTIRKWVPKEPVVHIDDSDVVKPDGYKFEALGMVRDGSKSTDTKTVYQKGISCVALLTLFDRFLMITPPLIVTFLFRLLSAIDFKIMSWQSLASALASLYPSALIFSISSRKFIIVPPVVSRSLLTYSL